jgi:hypothetical protein
MAQISLPPAERWLDQLAQKLLEVIVHVPATAEPASQTPDVRSRAIIRRAALKAARDTKRVGHTAIELFSREVALADDTTDGEERERPASADVAGIPGAQ